MFCANCVKELSKDAAYCEQCGTRVLTEKKDGQATNEDAHLLDSRFLSFLFSGIVAFAFLAISVVAIAVVDTAFEEPRMEMRGAWVIVVAFGLLSFGSKIISKRFPWLSITTRLLIVYWAFGTIIVFGLTLFNQSSTNLSLAESMEHIDQLTRELERTKRKASSLELELESIPAWKRDAFIECDVAGRSNEPIYPEKMCRLEISASEAEIGQSVAFDCFNGKCNYPNEKSEEIQTLQKRILKKKNNCIWVEGDNKRNSYDSRDYGWLCGDDYAIRRIVLGTVESYVAKVESVE